MSIIKQTVKINGDYYFQLPYGHDHDDAGIEASEAVTAAWERACAAL
jgi:hypothetical protein